MTTPARRPVGETLAAVAALDPALADEIRAALAAKRARDDLADAEDYLRTLAVSDKSRVGRALAVLLVEYDARAGKVPQAPQRRTAQPAVATAPDVEDERAR